MGGGQTERGKDQSELRQTCFPEGPALVSVKLSGNARPHYFARYFRYSVRVFFPSP